MNVLSPLKKAIRGGEEGDSVVHGGNLLSKHLHVLLVVGVGEGKEDLVASLGLHVSVVEVAISSDATGQVHVFLLDGDALGVDRAQVGVFEQTHDVGFGGLLQGLQSLGLEAQLVVHLHGDGSHEALEGSTGEQHVDRLLVLFDLAKRGGSWLVASHFALLHATLGGGSLLDGLRLADLGGHLGGGFGLGSSFGLGHCVKIELERI